MWASSNISPAFWQTQTAGLSCHTQYCQPHMDRIRDWQEYHIGPVNQKQINKARGGMARCELRFIKGCCSTVASGEYNRNWKEMHNFTFLIVTHQALFSHQPIPKFSHSKYSHWPPLSRRALTPTDYFCVVYFFSSVTFSRHVLFCLLSVLHANM